jgi:hypothetical protein
MMQLVPSDLEHLKGVNWEHIDRKDSDYFELGVTKILRAAGLLDPEPDRRSNAGSAASEDSLRRAKRRIASCRSVLKMNIYDYPEDSEKREKFKRDFTREMATALAYLAVQKLDPDGVKQVKMLVEDVQA